jgi:predicted transcriptional regulator
MTRRTFANELEQAADQIADVSRADLQTMLRRAALRPRNIEGMVLDSDADQAVDFLAVEMNLPRSEVLQTIIRDWLITGGRLPVETLDEESETDGTA